MRKSVSAGGLVIAFILFITGCKKKEEPPKLSSDAYINTFILHQIDNPSLGQDVIGRISDDSIFLEVKKGADITNLKPEIIITGASLDPATLVAQNFTNPVSYTVTAKNGFKRTYKVVVRILSNSKDIISFIFKQTNNPSLNADVSGIISNDSIFVYIPGGTDISSLVPTIVHSGASISPDNNQPHDFRLQFNYLVTAEDGSVKNYKVFTGSNRSIYMAGDDGYLYSINGVSGAVQWKFYTGVNKVPTYSNGTVFVEGPRYVIYAINASDGSLKWKSTPPVGFYNLTMPAIYNDKIYYAGAGYLSDANNIYEYYHPFVYALNVQTGNQIWLDTLFTGPLWKASESRINNVTVNDNYVCAYDQINGLYVYNANDGTELWAQLNNLYGNINPVLVNNTIFYNYIFPSGFRAVRADNGQEIWHQVLSNPTDPNSVNWFNSPTISNNVLYLVDSAHSKFYAMDLAGNIKWTNQNIYASYSAPFISDSTLYVINTTSNFIETYSTLNGSFKWRKGSYIGQLIVANNEIFIYNDKWQLTSLNATIGSIKWTFPVKNSLTTPFCVVDVTGKAYHVINSGEQQ